jgi:small subunit ribosomal protein S1
MSKSDDFSSLFEGSLGGAGERSARHLDAGQVVDAVVLSVTEDLVFVDVGTPQDGRIERGEFGGKLPEPGASIRLTVKDPSPEGPVLTMGLGRGGSRVDLGALALANEAGMALEGEIVRAVKGGVEVRLQGVQAFCPASQLELGYTGDLQEYV